MISTFDIFESFAWTISRHVTWLATVVAVAGKWSFPSSTLAVGTFSFASAFVTALALVISFRSTFGPAIVPSFGGPLAFTFRHGE